MVRHSLLGIAFVALILLSSCAPSTYHSRGHALLESGEYPRAIRELKLAIAENYRDVEAIRDMGVALYHTGKLNLAQAFLKLAVSRRPGDRMANYYLGLVYEQRGLIDDAIKQYSRYTSISPFNDLRKTIQGRLQVLTRQRMAEQIKTLVSQEGALETSPVDSTTIAVLYFANLSQNPDWTPLQKGLTDMLITDLSQVHTLKLVERARLQMLLDEMGLGMSGLVLESTAPRMGRMIGAARVVQGTFNGADASSVRIDARLADIRSGMSADAKNITGSLLEFYQLEKDLAFNLIDVLGVRLTREERDAIQRVPTKDLIAFMAYCRGLDYEDKGQWELAGHEFSTAAQLDPGFTQAREGVDRSTAFSTFSAKPVAPPPTAFRGANREQTATASDERTGQAPAVSETIDLMSRTATNVTPGFFPGLESREPTAAGTTTYGNIIDVKIHLPVKR